MVIRIIIRIGIFLILARAILSWIAPGNQHPAAVFLTRVTDPVLTPVRNLIGVHSGVDFSPIVVLVILYIVDALALGLLR